MRRATKYPHSDGDTTVLGPEIFAAADGKVICWRGENYVPQDQAADLAAALKQTQEYVGDDVLPAQPGWAWFDALTRTGWAEP